MKRVCININTISTPGTPGTLCIRNGTFAISETAPPSTPCVVHHGQARKGPQGIRGKVQGPRQDSVRARTRNLKTSTTPLKNLGRRRGGGGGCVRPTANGQKKTPWNVNCDKKTRGNDSYSYSGSIVSINKKCILGVPQSPVSRQTNR